MDEAARRHLEELRARRRTPRPTPSIGPLVERIQRDASRSQRQFGDVADLWNQLVPAALARQARLTRLQRGVLHVEVDSSAALYQLDRCLKSGVQAEMARRASAPLNRVKLQVRRES